MILMREILRIDLVSAGKWSRWALLWKWLEERTLCGRGKYWLLPPSIRLLVSHAVPFGVEGVSSIRDTPCTICTYILRSFQINIEDFSTSCASHSLFRLRLVSNCTPNNLPLQASRS